MGSQLQQALRILCSNTEWNYAVFWKLEHQARMMLTWEDAYFDDQEQHDLSENNQFVDIVGNLYNGRNSHESLALALAMMSYHVYSLGEGIVGQVAVTGKHLWITSDTNVTGSCSFFEYCDEWETQLSAGIRTIAVVAVVPHGVVQLGSLHKIAEDLKQVELIRDIFFELQDPSLGYIPVPCSMDSSSCLSDVSTRGSQAGAFLHCMNNEDRSIKNNMTEFPSFQKSVPRSSIVPLPGAYPRKTVEVINKHADPGYSISGTTNSFRDVGSGSEYKDDTLGNTQNGELCVPEPSKLQSPKDIEMKLALETEINHMDTLNASFRFSAGSELYEVLGPSFIEQHTHDDCEKEKTKTVTEMLVEGMSSSDLLMMNSSSDHLLEAVVANVCHSTGSDVNNAKSICKSVKSPLTTENMFEPSLCSTSSSLDCSSLVEEETLHRLNSSRSHSKCSEQSDRPKELAKINKKRGKPGENCRPRPRDRQLIQDRIKELRDLVPNGSKCSIDALLEQTIKHMIFMQCITKHADKLDRCTDMKLLDKETSVQGSSSYEQGSSWAMEVGSHLKVCPIKVENINMNRQMLVEMLCEDCSHFLDIADAIKSLGLIILKGITEAYKEKTWICFVVEGQNKRSLHRVEILWSLVQILQSKMEES
ncbi:hypothetical protein LguiA_011592 [Lonicera macranthoides]